MIFAWWGINGRAPVWHLPADEPDQAGWCDLAIRTSRLPGHPQETTENSVDLAHLRYVHGYGNVDRVDPLLVDGIYLRSRFDFTRTRNIAGIASLTFAPSANTHIYGLGYSYVEIHERSIGMDMRLWILATPVDGKKIDMLLASQVRAIRQPEAMDSGPRVSAGRVARPHHGQVHGVPAGARCPTGCGDLGPRAIPLPAAPLPIRWRG